MVFQIGANNRLGNPPNKHPKSPPKQHPFAHPPAFSPDHTTHLSRGAYSSHKRTRPFIAAVSSDPVRARSRAISSRLLLSLSHSPNAHEEVSNTVVYYTCGSSAAARGQRHPRALSKGRARAFASLLVTRGAIN